MRKVVLTGDRPTGRLHLGHYIGSLVNRVILQDNSTQYIMIADIQALTDNFSNPERIIQNTYEIVLDYLSVGLDSNKVTIFIQSQVPALTELTIYFMNMVTVSRLQRNPTLKTEIKQKAYKSQIPVGFFCYPISQAADILAFNPDLVPVGEDQVPMIEQTNEIVRKFNRVYNTNCFKEVEKYLSKSPRLVGIDGKNKMSKSLKNCIYLSDSKEDIKKKVFSMYTDPNHIRISDPGRIKNNVVFSYLDAFYEDLEELNKLKKHYTRGGLADTTIKEILNTRLQALLLPIREKRASLNKEDIKEILYQGTKNANIIANDTLFNVREIMGVNYFKDLK